MKQQSNQFWKEDSYSTEKVIASVVIEGVEFTVIDKAKTIYAGSYFAAPDLNSEPDIGASSQWFRDNKNRIIDSYTPGCTICLSIDYTVKERPCAIFHGQETSCLNQPEGFHVIEAEPTMLIKVKSTDAAWALTKKLTGYDNPGHMSPLFFLIWNIFCESGMFNFERTGDKVKGNHDAEYYYSNGDQYVTVPVKIKNT